MSWQSAIQLRDSPSKRNQDHVLLHEKQVLLKKSPIIHPVLSLSYVYKSFLPGPREKYSALIGAGHWPKTILRNA